jgi:hypothetical protein
LKNLGTRLGENFDTDIDEVYFYDHGNVNNNGKVTLQFGNVEYDVRALIPLFGKLGGYLSENGIINLRQCHSGDDPVLLKILADSAGRPVTGVNGVVYYYGFEKKDYSTLPPAQRPDYEIRGTVWGAHPDLDEAMVCIPQPVW